MNDPLLKFINAQTEERRDLFLTLYNKYKETLPVEHKGGKAFCPQEEDFIYRALIDSKICETSSCAGNIIMEYRNYEKYGNNPDIKNKSSYIILAQTNIQNYMLNVQNFWNLQPFFYDENKLFWFWQPHEYCYKMVDETDLMIALEDNLEMNGTTVNSKLKMAYMEAFRRVGRKKKPIDAPAKWIQFKDKAYSITSEDIHDVQPNYFFTNPIPHKLGKSTETPTMDKLFKEWVGEERVKTLYEIIAYCCYRDYPLHKIFCMVGTGRNGKSQFQRLMRKFLGDHNVCDTELDDLLNSRFEGFNLYKKLMCSMGETNFGTMSKTSKLKKLSGQDLVSFEKKGIQGFGAVNYAKLIINSNSLPSSLDTSDGFYRRWCIIRFPNEFPEGKDIITTIPDIEYENLAYKVTNILPKLLLDGKFTKEGTIEQRKNMFIMNSNPLPIFLKQYTEKGDGYSVLYGELFAVYVQFLRHFKMRKVTMREFKSSLEDDGYYIEKTSKKVVSNDNNNSYDCDVEYKNGHWVEGLRLKVSKTHNFCDFCDNMLPFPFQNTHDSIEIEKQSQSHKVTEYIIEEKVN